MKEIRNGDILTPRQPSEWAESIKNLRDIYNATVTNIGYLDIAISGWTQTSTTIGTGSILVNYNDNEVIGVDNWNTLKNTVNLIGSNIDSIYVDLGSCLANYYGDGSINEYSIIKSPEDRSECELGSFLNDEDIPTSTDFNCLYYNITKLSEDLNNYYMISNRLLNGISAPVIGSPNDYNENAVSLTFTQEIGNTIALSTLLPNFAGTILYSGFLTSDMQYMEYPTEYGRYAKFLYKQTINKYAFAIIDLVDKKRVKYLILESFEEYDYTWTANNLAYAIPTYNPATWIIDSALTILSTHSEYCAYYTSDGIYTAQVLKKGYRIRVQSTGDGTLTDAYLVIFGFSRNVTFHNEYGDALKIPGTHSYAFSVLSSVYTNVSVSTYESSYPKGAAIEDANYIYFHFPTYANESREGSVYFERVYGIINTIKIDKSNYDTSMSAITSSLHYEDGGMDDPSTFSHGNTTLPLYDYDSNYLRWYSTFVMQPSDGYKDMDYVYLIRFNGPASTSTSVSIQDSRETDMADASSEILKYDLSNTIYYNWTDPYIMYTIGAARRQNLSTDVVFEDLSGGIIEYFGGGVDYKYTFSHNWDYEDVDLYSLSYISYYHPLDGKVHHFHRIGHGFDTPSSHIYDVYEIITYPNLSDISDIDDNSYHVSSTSLPPTSLYTGFVPPGISGHILLDGRNVYWDDENIYDYTNSKYTCDTELDITNSDISLIAMPTIQFTTSDIKIYYKNITEDTDDYQPLPSVVENSTYNGKQGNFKIKLELRTNYNYGATLSINTILKKDYSTYNTFLANQTAIKLDTTEEPS